MSTEMVRQVKKGQMLQGILSDTAGEILSLSGPKDYPAALVESFRLGGNYIKVPSFGGKLTLDGMDQRGRVLSGLFNSAGLADLAALDPSFNATVGDRKGLSSDDSSLFKVLGGSTDPIPAGGKTFGDILLAHGKDSVQIGSKDRATKWFYLRRTASTLGTRQPAKNDIATTLSLAAGETQVITNNENTLQNTDVDIYLTLLDVGDTASETSALEDAKNKATAAISNATAAVASAKAKGADTSGMDTLVAKASTSFAAGDYSTATATAGQASSQAIDASLAIDNNALAKQLSDAQKNTSLTADAKAALVTQIQQQMADNSTSAAGNKRTLGVGFTFGANFATVGIIGGILAVVGVVAYAAMGKKRR